jgi:nicotinamide-nucleotide amidase
VAPALGAEFRLRPGRLVTVRVVGLAESDIQHRLDGFDWPAGVVFGTRTSLPENHVKLRCAASVPDDVLLPVVSAVCDRIGASVLSVEGLGGPGGGLPEVVGRILVERAATLAVAESCTGGRIASSCTSVAGASAWFLGGVVGYADAVKSRLLGVDPDTIAAHGAVSEPVARALAEGCRERTGATWVLSTTGVAGPSGGTAEKPVGTVWIGLCGPDGTRATRFRLPGDRERVQTLAAATALDLLRRSLLPSHT